MYSYFHQIKKGKNNGKAIYNGNYRPYFGYGSDIFIDKQGIKNKQLFLNESSSNCIYDYEKDNNALSEDRKNRGIYTLEYEQFQVTRI